MTLLNACHLHMYIKSMNGLDLVKHPCPYDNELF